MGRERVPIDRITWHREPSFGPPHDLGPLRASIEANGLKVLPLVDENYQLIDGARRLEVLKGQGHEEVQVVVSKDFEFTITNLRRAHSVEREVAKKANLRRLWEVYRATRAQVKARSHSSKARAAKVRNTGGSITPSLEARPLLTGALRMPIGQLQVAVTLFRAWEALKLPDADQADANFLRSLLVELDCGTTTPYRAIGAWQKYLARVPDDAVNVAEQAMIITNTAKTLSGVTKATAGLGPISTKHDINNLRAWDREISEARTHLFRLSVAIREGIDRQ